MKYYTLTIPMCFVLLSACTTYPVQATSNVGVDVAAVEETTSADEANVADEQDADDDRIICKRYQVTGSRFYKKRCMPWSAWKAQSKNAKQYLREATGAGSQGPGGPSGSTSGSRNKGG